MSLTHTATMRNTLADAITTAIDDGTADTTGDLIIMTSGDAVLATLSWTATPSFGSSAAGVITMNAINDETNATAGTAALFKFQNRDNTEIVRGSVTATSGGGDIELTSVAIGAGDTVSISSLTYTAST